MTKIVHNLETGETEEVELTEEDIALLPTGEQMEAIKKEQARRDALSKIAELEASQARPLRELLMDNTSKIARQKLADIDTKITELRKQL